MVQYEFQVHADTDTDREKIYILHDTLLMDTNLLVRGITICTTLIIHLNTRIPTSIWPAVMIDNSNGDAMIHLNVPRTR